MSAHAPGAQQTVQLRVQVVDMRSSTLDLVVPTYLPARDLTQRIARDAGLPSHWEDGRRRLYWLRARGRLLGDDERLEALGVVPGELVYLLPEPPHGTGVEEQEPDYPATRGYAASGALALVASVAMVCIWSVGWGVALSMNRSLPVVILPGAGLGFLATSLARHTWGGSGSRVRVVATGLALFIAVATLAAVAPVYTGGEPLGQVFAEAVPGFIAGMVGVLLGWMAWWGPVEPLPDRHAAQVTTSGEGQAVALVPCAICGQPVAPDVRLECPHQCGRYFHKGCYQARVAVYRGDKSICAICNQHIPAA